MPKIFKPRRGKKATMYGSKSTTVLSQGELFIEVPDSGVGTGKSKMKLGDGVTPYKDLPYAMGDTENDKIEFDSNTSGDVDTALNDAASGNDLGSIIAALKQAISLNQDNVTQLNEDLRKDFQDGCKKIADALTAAGVPTTGTDFSTLTQNIETLKTQSYNNGYNTGYSKGINDTKVGTATSSQVLTGYSFTNNSSVGINGSMPNRGNLNWNSSNTTYSVQPGYYSGGTLDSRTSYTNGYNSGYNKGKEEGSSSGGFGDANANVLLNLFGKYDGKVYLNRIEYEESTMNFNDGEGNHKVSILKKGVTSDAVYFYNKNNFAYKSDSYYDGYNQINEYTKSYNFNSISITLPAELRFDDGERGPYQPSVQPSFSITTKVDPTNFFKLNRGTKIEYYKEYENYHYEPTANHHEYRMKLNSTHIIYFHTNGTIYAWSKYKNENFLNNGSLYDSNSGYTTSQMIDYILDI